MVQPTIFDVAQYAGVSKSTVSKVLTQAPHVSGETRARVEAAMVALHYHPNAAARRLQSQKSKLIGLIMPRIGEPPVAAGFFSAFMFGAGGAAARYGYDLVWHVSAQADDTSVDEYARRYLRREVDGLLLANTRLEDPRVAALQASGCPFVIVGRYSDPLVYSVDVDNVAVGSMATRYLLDLGHRRIGLLNGMAELPFCEDREQGYRQALTAFGTVVEPALIYRQRLREDDGYTATRTFLQAEGGSALIVTDAALRVGCLRALHEQGIPVPAKCSVVGVDDVEPEQGQLGLTAVVQPTGEMAAIAVETLLQLLRGAPPPVRRRLLPPRLAPGVSTATREKQNGPNMSDH